MVRKFTILAIVVALLTLGCQSDGQSNQTSSTIDGTFRICVLVDKPCEDVDGNCSRPRICADIGKCISCGVTTGCADFSLCLKCAGEDRCQVCAGRKPQKN